jgi:ABC-type transport system substrate-binding protein
VKRRRLLQATAALAAAEGAVLRGAAAARAQAPRRQKVLRYAFQVAETGFDPAQIADVYSRYVTAHIFESLLIYDYLARPVRVKPLTAAAMPDVSADFRVFTFRVRPGIFFQDDPAFKGRQRELTAQDYVYSFKRMFDPATKSFSYSSLAEYGILGIEDVRNDALKNKKPFDYDREVEGLRAPDRYTLQIRLAQPAPHFIETFAVPDLYGAVAREVVEFYGDRIMEHPVGTGPFRLAEWRRSSRIVLERNPTYRDDVFDAEPPGDDPLAQRIARLLKGRKLPLVDRVEIAVVEEQQPRWLAFLNEEFDLVERLPNDFVHTVLPNGKLAPNLARRGIGFARQLGADIVYTVFNLKDPVIGGYTPEKVALRRAISLATDLDEEIRIPRRSQAVPAHTPILPHTYGFDPDVRTEMGRHDLARARALLDTYGYVDRDGDGWRELPDGSPLELECSTTPDQTNRQLDEIRKKHFDRLGNRLRFKVAKWPEHLKNARVARYQMWGVGTSAASTDSRPGLQRAHGPASGGQNISFFALPEYDRLYDELRVTPNGPRRLELLRQAVALWVAYVPYKTHVHRILTDLWQPWVVTGWQRHPFMLRFWDMIDIDPNHDSPA